MLDGLGGRCGLNFARGRASILWDFVYFLKSDNAGSLHWGSYIVQDASVEFAAKSSSLQAMNELCGTSSMLCVTCVRCDTADDFIYLHRGECC